MRHDCHTLEENEHCTHMQVLTRGMSDQTMRIKSMKLENKELRQQMADNAALWKDLQHDLVTLNGIPEGKGRRQMVSPIHFSTGCTMLSLIN